MVDFRDSLEVVAFTLTIIMVLYGLQKGFDNYELSLNILYFVVIILSQLTRLIEMFKKED